MMTKETDFDATGAIRSLSGEELQQASGGMRWVPGTKNPDVIDARGGQFRVGCFTWTLDGKGNLSSFKVT